MNTAQNSQSNFSPDFIVDGITTIVWGTDGILSSYIVTSARENQRVEKIPIQQGTGFTAIIILIDDGVDVEIEVIDDTAVNPPGIGVAITLSTPFGSIPVLVEESSANQARKREGMRTFRMSSYNAIAGLH